MISIKGHYMIFFSVTRRSRSDVGESVTGTYPGLLGSSKSKTRYVSRRNLNSTDPQHVKFLSFLGIESSPSHSRQQSSLDKPARLPISISLVLVSDCQYLSLYKV